MRNMNHFLMYCAISSVKLLSYMFHVRHVISEVNNYGISFHVTGIYRSFVIILTMFIGFICMCHAYMVYSYFNILLYFVLTGSVIVYSLAISMFVLHPKYFTLFYTFQLLEIIYTAFNFKYFCGRGIYLKNRKLGTNLMLKRSLNVSKY